ncbi:hypothetical protein GYB22_05775 [bacterium]|nr:hypothetical protein [bacterium]
MRRRNAIIIPVLFLLCCSNLRVNAQVYVLKDHRDTVHPQHLFDTLPELCDSFFAQLKNQDIKDIKKFVPEVGFLDSMYDTMNIESNAANTVYRQQIIQRKLEMQYKKMIKRAEKENINLKKLELDRHELKYAADDKGNEFCFVTIHCKRNKREYEVRFTAIKLNGKWFIGDDLTIQKM